MANPLVDYSDIENGILDELGRASFSTDEVSSIARIITKKIDDVWRRYEWPFVTKIESRYVQDREIEFTSSGLDDIGEVFAVYATSPFNGDATAQLAFDLRYDTIYVPSLDEDATSAFVHYRIRPPVFRGVEYASATTYSEGNKVWATTTDTDGTSVRNYYKSLTDSNQGNAVTDTSYWEKIQIPRQFRNYLIAATYAQILRAEEDYEMYGQALREAEAALVREIRIVETQEDQQYPTNFISGSSTQSRLRNSI